MISSLEKGRASLLSLDSVFLLRRERLEGYRQQHGPGWCRCTSRLVSSRHRGVIHNISDL